MMIQITSVSFYMQINWSLSMFLTTFHSDMVGNGEFHSISIEMLSNQMKMCRVWHFPFRWSCTFYINSIKRTYRHKGNLYWYVRVWHCSDFGCKERNSIDKFWYVQTREIFEYQIIISLLKRIASKRKWINIFNFQWAMHHIQLQCTLVEMATKFH